jgi:glycosyltransferase involved in cell wall biosynthesis
MKILYFIDCLASGGKERRLVELIKGLTRKDDVTVDLVLMSRDVHYKDIFGMNVSIHYLIRKSRKDLSVFAGLYRICREVKPDIVHSWDSMTAVYSAVVCKLLGIKIVNGMVNDCPDNRKLFRKPLLRARLTFPFADLVVGNSLAGLTAYKAPVKRSLVINNGFDFRRTDNLESPETWREALGITTRFAVGMVASFSDFKDYPTFYRGAHLVLHERKDVTFIAIGKDTDSEMSARLVDPQYSEYFKLLGKRSDVESMIRLLDIGVLITFTEGISNSILEYMASGKPVIATLGGGTAELVIDGGTGYLIRQSDPQELARRISEILDDDKLRQEMGARGKLRIGEEFSLDRMISRFYEAYGKLLSN